jgi:hypothetical protein
MVPTFQSKMADDEIGAGAAAVLLALGDAQK